MTTLFDDTEVTHDATEHRAVRRLALGGAIQLVRTRNGWNVTEAAANAGLAPMTWRRVEDGLDVRERSHAALDRVLKVAFGTVKRALADDVQMLELLKLTGVDTRHVASDNAAEFLEAFAEQTRTGSPRQKRMIGPQRSGPVRSGLPGHGPVSSWPAVDGRTRDALEAMSMHVPAVQPTDLQLVQRMVDQLTRTAVTPAVRDLIEAALKAMPDLIARQLDQAEQDIRADQTEEVAR